MPEGVEWNVYYEDMFDRECPPSVTANGRGVDSGLVELWRRFLSETVQAGGKRGFSRFYLSWEQGSANVDGDWKGATRLREWVDEAKKAGPAGGAGKGGMAWLEKIAKAHADLLRVGRSSDEILEAAAAASDREDFEARLSGLTGG